MIISVRDFHVNFNLHVKIIYIYYPGSILNGCCRSNRSVIIAKHLTKKQNSWFCSPTSSTVDSARLRFQKSKYWSWEDKFKLCFVRLSAKACFHPVWIFSMVICFYMGPRPLLRIYIRMAFCFCVIFILFPS